MKMSQSRLNHVKIHIFDKQTVKINNMKRLIYGVALIGMTSIGFAFINKEAKGDNTYCVQIHCAKSSFKETVVARETAQARKIIEARYPDCRIGTIATGACK
jgi:hypothetical protein